MVLGDAWQLWEQKSGVSTNAILPRQLVWLAHSNLNKLHEQFRLNADTKSAARASYAVVTEESKKRRASA